MAKLIRVKDNLVKEGFIEFVEFNDKGYGKKIHMKPVIMYTLRVEKQVTKTEVVETETTLEEYIAFKARTQREKLGINQTELSKRSFNMHGGKGISNSFINRVENASSSINLSKLKVLANTLELDVMDLFPQRELPAHN